MKENIIVDKSYKFAVRIIKLYLYLKKEKNEFELSKQILRSGTAIGSNVEEAVGGYSRKDFSAKLGISYREARETKFWLRLLHDTEFVDTKLFESLYYDCEELLKIIGSIQVTLKKKNI